MEDLQLLTTASSEFEMEVMKSKLEDAGIECFIEDHSVGNMLPALDYSRGVRIYVHPDDLERAEWLVTNSEDDLDDDMEIGVGD